MPPAINVTVLRRTLRFPDRCARCFKARELVKRQIGYDPRKLKADAKDSDHPDYQLFDVGFCKPCARWQDLRAGTGIAIGAIGVLCAFIITIWLDIGSVRISGWIFTILAFIFVVPGIFVFDSRRDKSVQLFAFTQGTLTLSFKHADYANQFMKMNHASPDKP
jgi:hypothetical protein